MGLDSLPSYLDYQLVLFNHKHGNSYKIFDESLHKNIKDLICGDNYIKNVTLFYPFKDKDTLNEFRDCFLSQEDFSCLISNVSLTDLTNADFVTNFLVPRRLSLFNVYDGPSSKIRFLINSKGVLLLVLDLEVFRTLGLSNCKIVNRNKEESITVEIDLMDSNYTKNDSKLYQRVQQSLSKISSTTVIISSEDSNGIDYSQLKEFLEKTSSDVKISRCNAHFRHTKVNLCSNHGFVNANLKDHNKFNLNFLTENLNLLKESQETQVYRSKRRKVENYNPDLNSKMDTLDQNRDILVKIFNTVKKNSSKNVQTIKNMIHELNQKNIHSSFDYYNNDNSPLNNIMEFIDHLNLQSLRDSDPDSKVNSEPFELLKINNGIISKECVFNLFKQSCDILLPEVEVFIMSLYMLSEKKMRSEPLVRVFSNSGRYVHIVCRKCTHQGELTVLFINFT